MDKQSREMKSPRRIMVAINNRAKRQGISEAGRQRLREAALANQPWKHATGPRTPWGKYLSSQNGKLRQKGLFSVREARAEVRADRELLQFVLAHPELGILNAEDSILMLPLLLRK